MRGCSARARLLMTLAAVAGLILSPSAAPAADPIEERLGSGLAADLADRIADAKVKAVGVLNFRVQKGNGPATFSAGPMNAAVTRMVENALLVRYADPDDKPKFDLIKDAGRTAAGLKKGLTYLSPEGLEQLFALDYDLAWGTTKTKADAFVTGVVRLDADRVKATVEIELITRQHPAPVGLAKFEVRTTRGMLNDVCDSYVSGRAKIGKAGPGDEDDRVTLLSLGALGLEEPATAQPPKVASVEKPMAEQPKTPDRDVRPVGLIGPADLPVKLEILYDDKPQKLVGKRSPTGEPLFQVAEPEERQRVTFRLTNRLKEKLAVALAVNGRNTLHGEDVALVPAARLTKWVIDPEKSVLVEGFYPKNGGRWQLIEGLSDEESVREELDTHPKLGAIQMFVFAEGKDGEGDEPTDAAEGTRGFIDTAGLKSPREAACAVSKKAGTKIAPAGLMARTGTELPAEVERVTFGNPVGVYSQVIWYYDRKTRP